MDILVITIISSYEANSSVWSMSVSKTVNVKTAETMAGSYMMPGVTVNASEEEKKSTTNMLLHLQTRRS